MSTPEDPVATARLASAFLLPIYRRLFATDGSAAEYAEYEKKDYYLSPDMITLHGKVIVETIAGIANLGRATGLIMCRGRLDVATSSPSPPPLEDSQRLDLLMRTAVYPPVHFTPDRIELDGSMVDVIVIPRSNQRPHFMRDLTGSHRFFIPLRGAANNISAARHQIDEMYQEATIETMRRAFPGIRIDTDERDRALAYASDIGYGLSPE